MTYQEIKGWFDENDQRVYQELLNQIPDKGTMVELGVCQGRSMCSVADTIIKKQILPVAVDTFEGTENEGEAHADAKQIDWEAKFKENVAKFGLGNVATLRMRTDEAHKNFIDGLFDLVFIDADHSAEAVAKDIFLWKGKLKPTGILCGHDWNWPSVREGLAMAGLDPVHDGNMWWVLPKKLLPWEPLFSVCLIARNEEKCLPRAIASLKNFQERGGKCVLVDTGSTDKTAQIARDAGFIVEEVGDKFITIISKEEAETINNKFLVDGEPAILKEGDRVFNYGAARNYAASLAPMDVVSMMDCDESFTVLNVDAINRYIIKGFTQFEYQFVFSHLPDGTPGLAFRQSKMYDRRDIKWVGGTHEVISGRGRIKLLNTSELYLEHYQNLETNRSGYLRGLALECFREPQNDRNSHYFARELLWSGRPKSAIQEFKRHVEMIGWPAERAQSFIFMGEAYCSLAQYDLGVEAYHKAIDIDASRREAWIHLADHYMRMGDPQRTLCYARACEEVKLSDYYANNISHYREVPHEMMYWAYAMLGEREKGRGEFNKAFVFNPSSPKYLHEAVNFYKLPTISFVIPSLGRPEGLRACVNSIEKLNYPRELIEICVLDEAEPTVPQKVKMGVERTNHEYVVYMANDTEMTPDSLKIAVLSSLVHEKALVAFHSEPVFADEGNICAHFIVRRDFIPALGGEIFSTRMTHCGVDNLLWAKAKKLDQAYHEDKALISHNHFSKGKEYDDVYKRGWSHREEDLRILQEELDLLK